ncbi:hypothetical protein QYE76_006403 [Lolium multiflorum]|uniref:Retrotransposon gag domain-containing protein n=1 Tax=Lolium multiflorum TaxID=4521 RepID=A0AAD8W419_LOLMU|nr:hypothetical protein QYE76_006403 [Lolium multiflorum]
MVDGGDDDDDDGDDVQLDVDDDGVDFLLREGISRRILPAGELFSLGVLRPAEAVTLRLLERDIFDLFLPEFDKPWCAGISMDEVKKKLFSMSLSGKAAHWYKLLKDERSLDWKDIVPLFYSKFYPPSEIHKDRNHIYNFWPHDGESIAQAWERLKSLMLKCPNHELPGNIIIDNFYARLSFQDKTLLDTTCSGSFTSNKEEFKRDLLDRIKENAEDWENDKGYADKPPFKPLPPKEGNEEKEEKKKKKKKKKKEEKKKGTKKKKKENKKKEVMAYPRVNEITLEILVTKYSRNRTKSPPQFLFFRKLPEHRRRMRGEPRAPHHTPRARGAPLGCGQPWPLRLPLFAYLSLSDLKTPTESHDTEKTFRAAAIAKSRFGDRSLCGTCRTGNCPRVISTAVSTAIFTAIAVSMMRRE